MMPRRLNLTAALGLTLAAFALVLGACGRAIQYAPLTPENPVAQIAEGLTLSVSPAALPADFGVQLSAVPAETLRAGDGDAFSMSAAGALPAHLFWQSPLYRIETAGALPRQLFLSVVIPAGANTGVLDLFAWNGAAWSFLPAHRVGGQMVAEVAHVPAALALFERAPVPPLALVTLKPGEALTAAAVGAANGVLLEGVSVQADGALTGQLPGVPRGQALALYPLIRNDEAAAVLSHVAVRANHTQALVTFAVAGGYDGLALDYRGVTLEQGPSFSHLVAEVAAQLHAEGKTLFVMVDTPVPQSAGYSTAGYDWRALGASADALLMRPPADPAAFGNGVMESLLAWAVGEVDRGRLRMVTSALSADRAGDAYTLVDQAAALAPFGAVTLAADEEAAVYAGQAVTLTLSGLAQTLSYDPAAFAARFTYADDAGRSHTVWLTSADTLRQRLALAEKYRLGGVAVAGLLAPGVPDDLATAITQYKVSLAAAAQAQAELWWTVRSPAGVLAEATAQPGQPYVYVVDAPGDYEFSARLKSGGSLALGSVAVSVADITPTPAPSGGTGGGSSGGSGGGTVFVPPPPVASGSFELGGQVPGFIAHPAQMKQAGMTWVKFQAIDPPSQIAAGKAAGFKVLVSAVGDIRRAADPNYWPEYAAWVGSIAAMGADAIEVWNEANLDREWPYGQISGAAYTELLKQAYTAIKAANPSTIVIGGAPAPTGAAGAAGCTPAFCNDDTFLAQMAAAGAANYMDCVGVHYNTGTTSPHATTGSALSGYHYSYYFWPMVNLYYNAFGGSRQLCFTELGYVSPEGYESIPLPSYFQWAASVTVAEQAQWLAEAASLSASSGKVRMMIVFNVDFKHYLPNDPQAGYAMIRPDGTCPACAALDAVMP